MPTLSVASIDTSEGYHRPTKLKFDPTTKAGFKKAKVFDGADYWKAMSVTDHIALALNRDETGGRAYIFGCRTLSWTGSLYLASPLELP